jgi:hypothetical protein
MAEPVIVTEADALLSICTELRKINETLQVLEHTISDKFGGADANNLNVTLFTDSPIEVTNKGKEK